MANPLDEIFSKFESDLIAGPASLKMITEAETRLGTRFPPSYRYFLSRYGAAIGAGVSVPGLFHHPDEEEQPLWTDVVTLNLKWVSQEARGNPPRYIAIGDDGTDYTYYLDTGAGDVECPVVVLGPGVDYVLIARNFTDYVAASCNGEISF